MGILSYRLQGSIHPRVDIFQCTKAFHALHTWRDAGGDARDESHVQSSGVGMMRFLLNDSMPSRNFQLCNKKTASCFFVSANSWRFRNFMIGLQSAYKREALLASTLPFLPSTMDPPQFAEDAWNDARCSRAITIFHTYFIFPGLFFKDEETLEAYSFTSEDNLEL